MNGHREQDPPPSQKRTVSFLHNFKSQNFKLSVSIPKNKHVVYVSVLPQSSNCQGLGRKSKHEILKTDRTLQGRFLRGDRDSPRPLALDHATQCFCQLGIQGPRPIRRVWTERVERHVGTLDFEDPSSRKLGAIRRASHRGAQSTLPSRELNRGRPTAELELSAAHLVRDDVALLIKTRSM